MKISYLWLSDWIDLKDQTPEKVGDILTFRGLEVESVERMDAGFEKVVTGKILERAQHPNADRLSVCKVSLGTGEPLEIVCGAQNMKAGDIVAVAQVGAVIPNGLKIEKSKIRGVESFGMLCSLEELKLAESAEGILILPATTPLGQGLAQVLGRNDTVFSLKITANRGDCLSYVGLARELSSHLKRPLKVPAVNEYPVKPGSVSVSLGAGDSAPQFFTVEMDGVKVSESPDWVKRKLEASGMRSINSIVDATNICMLEFGHPVHAYDRAKIEGGKIGVREARAGEELPLLDATAVKLSGGELVIEDGKKSVGLAGVMGGGNSEVVESTTTLLLECAEFHPVLVRKTAGRYSKKTESSHRFERGVDPAGLTRVISRLATLVTELSGGKVVSFTKTQREVRAQVATQNKTVSFTLGWMSRFLGFELTPQEVTDSLKGLGFEVRATGSGSDGKFDVTVPSFRLDVNIPEDCAEEVARVLGYDRIPATIPVLKSAPTAKREDRDALKLAFIQRAQDAMVAMGFNETVHFAFTNPSILTSYGFKNELPLMNPLSEELSVLVPSLLPGLIENALENQNHHFGSEKLSQRLFEVRPVFQLAADKVEGSGAGTTGIRERLTLSLVMSGNSNQETLKSDECEVDFYDLKSVAMNLFARLGTKGVRVSALGPDAAKLGAVSGLFHPGQAASVRVGADLGGAFGVLHPLHQSRLKLKGRVLVAEFDVEVLMKYSRAVFDMPQIRALNEFPPMERDFALVTDLKVTADQITGSALKAGKPLVSSARVFDVYQGPQVGEGKRSVAIRVTFQAADRSLAEAEVEAVSKKLVEALVKDCGAQLR